MTPTPPETANLTAIESSQSSLEPTQQETTVPSPPVRASLRSIESEVIEDSDQHDTPPRITHRPVETVARFTSRRRSEEARRESLPSAAASHVGIDSFHKFRFSTTPAVGLAPVGSQL
jgi:hypothetical protein